MKALYRKVDIDNLREDLHFIQNKINTSLSSLQLNKLDIYLILGIRDYIYKSLKELIKYRFLSEKEHQNQ